MNQAVICPVCGGKGQVNSDSVGTGVNLKTCYGCGGKGWVEIGQEAPYVPYNPYIPRYPYNPYLPTVTWTASWGGV